MPSLEFLFWETSSNSIESEIKKLFTTGWSVGKLLYGVNS